MIIAWNVKGLNKTGKIREISSRLLSHKPDIIVLVETRVKLVKAKVIRDKSNLRGK